MHCNHSEEVMGMIFGEEDDQGNLELDANEFN